MKAFRLIACNMIFVFLAVFFINSESLASVGDKIVTSKGAEFEQVKYQNFTIGWKAPDGTVWSDEVKGLFYNEDLDGTKPLNGVIQKSEATEACKRIGGILPTADDYFKLQSYFENNGYVMSKQGLSDLKLILGISGSWFWSSSIDSGYDNEAYAFNGLFGSVEHVAHRHYSSSVYCVGR